MSVWKFLICFFRLNWRCQIDIVKCRQAFCRRQSSPKCSQNFFLQQKKRICFVIITNQNLDLNWSCNMFHWVSKLNLEYIMNAKPIILCCSAIWVGFCMHMYSMHIDGKINRYLYLRELRLVVIVLVGVCCKADNVYGWLCHSMAIIFKGKNIQVTSPHIPEFHMCAWSSRLIIPLSVLTQTQLPCLLYS